MAFTSGIHSAESNAESTGGHAVEIVITGHHARNVRLYNRPGDDMMLHKGDLWKINITDFHFPDSCINITEIQRVSIIETDFDGWNIESIVTLVKDSGGGVQMLTQNLDVNRWIDGDGHYTSRRFELTFS